MRECIDCKAETYGTRCEPCYKKNRVKNRKKYFCKGCNKEIFYGSTHCLSCAQKHLAKNGPRKVKTYKACIDCGSNKTTKSEQRASRCYPCSMEHRKKKRGIPLYTECKLCGVPKEGRNQERAYCRRCARQKTAETSVRRTNPAAVKMRDLVGAHVRNAMRDNKKGQPCFQHLPYDVFQLMKHLEAQFTPKMSWENQGSYWHLDHIVPQCLLPYDSYDHPNFLKCWDLRNLQPLEASANCSKRDKLTKRGKVLMEILNGKT